jgi:hypothetical protein
MGTSAEKFCRNFTVFGVQSADRFHYPSLPKGKPTKKNKERRRRTKNKE